MSLDPGTTLAHFEVLSPLGAGGMGEVYRARDTRLGRVVALKVLPDAVALDAGRFARFEREAQILASLNEPGILTVHSIEEAGDRRFIVTELVDGRELTELIPPQGLPLDTFLDLSVQLARAIAAAHRGGILHRDLKPANVMVTRSGLVKVLDFGLAKAANGADPQAADSAAALTRTGAVMGTLPYMSPEQLHGRELDARSDVFSLGVVCYEMLCGVRPFGGESAAALSSAILRDAPAPLASRRGELPRQIDRILRHCLEKDPDRRYADAAALLYDLESLRDELGSSRSSTGAAAPDGFTTTPPASAAITLPPAPVVRRDATTEPTVEQEIRFCTTTDGISIAYATVGRGTPLVRSLGWFTHLELEWKWPEGRQFWERLARCHRLVRYDGRGMGLSKAAVDDFDLDARVRDLEAVVDAAGLERFALMGMSEGGQTAIAYAARHPERVSHLVLYGTFPDGSHFRVPGEREKWQALLQLVKTGWGQETPVFRQLFTHLFLGTSADAAQIAYFNEMQRASASAETAASFMRFNGRVDIAEAAGQVRCPTLVLHRRADLLVPFEAGRKVAAVIRGARFIPMDGDNHWLLLRDPGAEEYADVIERFLAEPSSARAAPPNG